MPRREDWEQEIYDGMRTENWTLNGPGRLVKVCAIGPVRDRVTGYVTQERYILGKTPWQLERDLGLRPYQLRDGYSVYRLRRLPGVAEYKYELTALYPSGLAFNPKDLEEALSEFKLKRHGGEVHCYPAGSRFIHQWRLLTDIPAEHLEDVKPGQTYRS